MRRPIRGRQRGFRKDCRPAAAVENPGPAHALLSPGTDPRALLARRRAAANELVRADADDERDLAARLRNEIAQIDQALGQRQRDAVNNGCWAD